MAYGFGTTFGTSGTTDNIDTPNSYVQSTLVSRHCWVYKHGDGGGGVGVVWRWDASGIATDVLGYSTPDVAMIVRTTFSTTSGIWPVPAPTTDAWVSVIETHDRTGLNAPIV